MPPDSCSVISRPYPTDSPKSGDENFKSAQKLYVVVFGGDVRRTEGAGKPSRRKIIATW